MKTKPRIIVLTGSSLPNLNTLATLIDGDVNVVGAVVANQKKHGINTKFLKSAIKKQGFFKVLFQVFQQVIYKVLNSRKDEKILRRLFDKERIYSVIKQFDKDILYENSYDSEESLHWIKSKKPDLIVIHTPYWVPKKVRNIVDGKVIGGHPGITQYYRGVHSPFWAIYNNDINNLGYSIFWVDSGVDSGDIIYQGKIEPNKGDSYVTLSWRGMKLIAENILSILSNINDTSDIISVANESLTEETIFYHPTLYQYIKYRLKQKIR